MMIRALYRPKPERTELSPMSMLVLDEIADRAAPPKFTSDYDALGREAWGSMPNADNWGPLRPPRNR